MPVWPRKRSGFCTTGIEHARASLATSVTPNQTRTRPNPFPAARGKATLGPMTSRLRLTIPRRVFLAFALVLAVSGVALVASLVQHQRTAVTLSLVHEGYLPLALTVSEARVKQSGFVNLLDRVLSERDTSYTRIWLNDARRERPATLARALAGVAAIERLAPPEGDRQSLARLRRELMRVRGRLQEGERRYQELYAALDSSDKANAERILTDLRARERNAENVLLGVWTALLQRLEDTSARAAAEQDRALGVLAALVVVALVVGIGVAWWSQRVLSPLPRLQERVEAVARGEFVQELGPDTDDEIGRLAREFERMVAALVARDASLRAASEKVLQAERLAAIGRMAAHVAHEVRNPLSSIGLNVEMLEEELRGAGAETREVLGAIHREIEHLRGVTEEYLRVARPASPRLEPESVAEVVRATAQFYGPELEKAGVALHVAVEEPLPLVAIDEAQIRQVLLNLLKNAREAVGTGGHVRLEAGARDTGVVVRVADDGPGMSEHDRARVFDLFYTTKQHGSGLGLPLSQQIVVAHGGVIRCESAPGQGAMFEIWLPAYAAGSRREASVVSSAAG